MKASSSSSGSSSSSSSSSGSESGSTSSDTESSSSAEERNEAHGKSIEKVVTRRKSSELKSGSGKVADLEKQISVASTSSNKSRVGNAGLPQRAPRLSTVSTDDDIPATKKSTRPANNPPSGTQKRKTSVSAAAAQSLKPASGGSGGGKAPPAGVKAQQTENASSKYTATKTAGVKHSISSNANSNLGNGKESFHATNANELNKELPKQTKVSRLPVVANSSSSSRLKQSNRSKPQPKRNVVTKPVSTRKSSEESDSDSASESGDDSSSSSESEGSDSSNSFASQPTKLAKGKRGYTASKLPAASDSDELHVKSQEITPRKLTRSLSTRRSKQQLRHGAAGGGVSESDSDALADLDAEKRSLSKSPAKKPTVSKCKTKKEIGTNILPPKPRSLSPPQQVEKKCPIEGCDSSGHLSGNLDRHFLPEACPIYHNMSASECKERANERKQRDEHRQKSNGCSGSAALNTSSASLNCRMLTLEQKDFLAKIRESRTRFKPVATAICADKVKLEKDCTDEDREPCLTGLVPDYDLQLFREAQAIASEKIEDELKDLPVGKGIKYITMGKYKMKVWYQSPYPDDAARLPKMYICEFCLRYQKSETGIKRHALKCIWRHPPGDEIYRKGKLQVWQVDGKRHKQYCQHLCLLAKFFLDHKTLYYDVEPFLFYIMTLADVDGCHTVGYFSKEKNSFYNVSCILTLPPYQRKGYGRLLIDFSYLLTRVEHKIGSPEKPLSDLGLISYRSYWKDVLLDYLCNRTGNTLSIKDVSQEMAIYSYDIVSTLQALGMMKYWKGKHIVLKKQDVLEEYEERVKHRGNFPKIDDTCLRWSPFVPAQVSSTP